MSANGHLVDLVIAITLLEAMALAMYKRVTGRGIALRDYAANLAAGLCLMLAVRSALVNSVWYWTALCLLAAGLAHATDLWLRWQHRPLPKVSP